MVSGSEAELSNRKQHKMSKTTNAEEEHPLGSSQIGGKGLPFCHVLVIWTNRILKISHLKSDFTY